MTIKVLKHYNNGKYIYNQDCPSFIIHRLVPPSLLNVLLLFCTFLILPSCLCSEFFRMKSTTNKHTAITAVSSLLPTPEGFYFPGCQTNLKGTAYMSEEPLSLFQQGCTSSCLFRNSQIQNYFMSKAQSYDGAR